MVSGSSEHSAQIDTSDLYDSLFALRTQPPGWPHSWNMGHKNDSTQYQSGAATSRSDLKQATRATSALHKLTLAQQALVAAHPAGAGVEPTRSR